MNVEAVSSLKVITISNRKGGAGKTTVSVNLAATLAALGFRVLLIDLDSQGHCAVGLGIKVAKDQRKIHDIFRSPELPLADTIINTSYPRLSLCPADQTFEHGSGGNDDRLLANALNNAEIQSRFDLIISDTPPSLDSLLLNALNAANWVLIPFVPHPLSFEGIKQLTRVLFKVMSSSNPKLKILGFIPVMMTNHIKQHRNTMDNISNDFGGHRLLQGIRTDIRLAESFGAGRPIPYYDVKSRATADFIQLGKTIKGLLAEQAG